ncbi:piRNA biogenesis protein EXD1 isoform X1 [Gopherus flavomarginatus]|uniref:piRNA biogenesis protein EXD1 isoform X1 n=1 Tax=Gopherus flavomarginatus TaxID=286002 RepID=UPI0021CBFEDA|nr:piRNA biogenesis protein EXD1 isoform X1 [Gopherus flavomarginatus]XP_050810775.1 piRNA biogenesis protein EXD1 isoform X1 [Gopherus flavomarginatus]XP_050810776.1 piRNA biogenesis protein EXD1 isoform X1 [Gopherus flavomarginatus]XP_050810778.1 piRNA biogenesis protein EXD1 isoform X1 [Gopherus flavomarginatus]XP_050810779.1 piRNA biogenesis protein EXD1 isoform X1 [Gopherus flavomarginatus]
MDPSSDYQFLNEILGKAVKITLKCGVFQGILQHVDSSRSIILSRVKNLETGRSMAGVKMFFAYEIVNVELLEELEQNAAKGAATPIRDNLVTRGTDMDRGEPADHSPQSSSRISPESQVTILSNLKYTLAEEEEEENMKYIVIDQFQQKFGPAMLHIKKQSVLGMAAEGVNLCRHGRLCWLQVATRSRVFLFDIFLLGPRVFKNGLQVVLEDKNILKVSVQKGGRVCEKWLSHISKKLQLDIESTVIFKHLSSVLQVMHDCRLISDCLSHQHGIILSNVFDTQVADVLHFSNITGGFLPHRISSLQECLMRHLKMSPRKVSFLAYRQQAVQENPDIWFVRPLPPLLLKVLALETVYLLPLRLLLLDEMMSDLTTLVDGYLNSYREGSADLLGSTEISCMELPEELQQLADFQKLRREKALKKYKVNEEGLLIRPPLESKGKKAAEVEEKQGEDSCWLSSNGAAFKKTSFHPQDPLHQKDDEQKQVVDNWENKKSGIGYKNPPFEMESGARDLVSWNSVSENTQAMGKGFPPEQKPHAQAAGSLQEEISLLFLGNKDEDLFCAKHSTTVSASTPPKISSSLHDAFQVPRQPSLSVLPPCPVLETVDLCQNPSLKMTQTYISNFPVRPERERSSAVHFAFPSGLNCRMPAPSPAGK